VMREVGMDISGAKPMLLTDALARDATLLVTMGCGESCPFVPGLERADWELPDPKGQPPERVRAIREGRGGDEGQGSSERNKPSNHFIPSVMLSLFQHPFR